MKIAHLSDIHVLNMTSSLKAILNEVNNNIAPLLLLRTYNPFIAATISLVLKNVLEQKAFPILPSIAAVHHNYRYLSENFKRLIDDLNDRNPDLVVITGDLTTTARSEEFQEALSILKDFRHFPDRLMIVAGNHDRININGADKIENYFPFVKNGICEKSMSNEFSVLGLDSTVEEDSIDSYVATNTKGKFNLADIEKINKHFSSLPSTCIKIVATHHHPYSLPAKDFEKWGTIGKWVANKYMGPAKNGDELVKDCHKNGVRLLLFGHKHIPTQRQEGSLMMACSNAVTHQYERGFMTYRMFYVGNQNVTTEWIRVPTKIPVQYENTAELAEVLRDIELYTENLVHSQKHYTKFLKIENELDMLITEQMNKIHSSERRMKDAIDKL